MNIDPHMEEHFVHVSQSPENIRMHPPSFRFERPMISGRYQGTNIRQAPPIVNQHIFSTPYGNNTNFMFPFFSPQSVIFPSPLQKLPSLEVRQKFGKSNNKDILTNSSVNESKVNDLPEKLSCVQYFNYAMNNPTYSTVPSFLQKHSFFYMPVNVLSNQINQYVYPVANNCRSQPPSTHFKKQCIDPNESNVFSCVSSELSASAQGINYFKSESGAPALNQNINNNLHVLCDVSKQSVNHHVDCSGKIEVKNKNQNMQQHFLNNTPINVALANNVPVASNTMTFPATVRIAPPILFKASDGNLQKNIDHSKLQYKITPPEFPVPFITNTHLPNSKSFQCNSNSAQDVSPNRTALQSNPNTLHLSFQRIDGDSFPSSKQYLLPRNQIIDSKRNINQNSIARSKSSDRFLYNTNDSFEKHKVTRSDNIIDCNEKNNGTEKVNGGNLLNENQTECYDSNNKKLNLKTSNILKINTYEATINNQIPTQNKINTLNDVENGVQIVNNTDSRTCDTNITSALATLNKNKETQKTVPVSCFPVPGTFWCVVGTNDKRVFFHDEQHNVSIWERPHELLGRNDVNEMISKFTFSFPSKPLNDDCKASNDHTCYNKSLRNYHEEIIKTLLNKNSKNKKTRECENSKELILIETTSNVGKKDTFVECSFKQKVKLFCEMLSEKNILGSSTWEKELHKFIFDSRYTLLPLEERKQIFISYCKRKEGEENFISLLTDIGVNSELEFTDIAYIFAEDVRFKAIKDMKIKEKIFNEYILRLKNGDQEFKEQQKSECINALSDNRCLDKEQAENKRLTENDCYKDVRNNSSKEDICKVSGREKFVNNPHAKKMKHMNSNIKKCERKENGKALLNIKTEVQKENGSENKLANLKTMLADLIKESHMCWYSAKKILKADPRWTYSQDLGLEKCEKYFIEHINNLKFQKKAELNKRKEFPISTVQSSMTDMKETIIKDPELARFVSYSKAFWKYKMR